MGPKDSWQYDTNVTSQIGDVNRHLDTWNTQFHSGMQNISTIYLGYVGLVILATVFICLAAWVVANVNRRD